MTELFKGIEGSPITSLTSNITSSQTTISIADDSALPDAPNICTIGYGEQIETIKYETKSNGVLQNVTRGVEGTPRAWQAGTEVARFFTAYDHNTIIENFTSHLAENVNQGNPHGIDAKANKQQETPFQPDLKSDWTHGAGGGLRCFKNEFNIVYVFGEITGGIVGINTQLARLPTGYRPRRSLPLNAIRTNDASTAIVQIGSDGYLTLGNLPTSAGGLRINGCFLAEE